MTDLSLPSALGMFVAYLLTICLVLRSSRREPAVLVIAAGAAIYLVGLAILAIGPWATNFWSVSISYWFLILCFLVGFGAIYKSLSLHMLVTLLNRPGYSACYDELAEGYLQKSSFADRLQVMTDKGLAVERAGRFELSGKGLSLSRKVRALQNLYGIKKSG